MEGIHIIQASPQQLKKEIVKEIKELFNDLKKSFQLKEQTQYLSRKEEDSLKEVEEAIIKIN